MHSAEKRGPIPMRLDPIAPCSARVIASGREDGLALAFISVLPRHADATRVLLKTGDLGRRKYAACAFLPSLQWAAKSKAEYHGRLKQSSDETNMTETDLLYPERIPSRRHSVFVFSMSSSPQTVLAASVYHQLVLVPEEGFCRISYLNSYS